MIIRPYGRRDNNDELQKLLLAWVLLHVHLIGGESFLMGLRLLHQGKTLGIQIPNDKVFGDVWGMIIGPKYLLTRSLDI